MSAAFSVGDQVIDRWWTEMGVGTVTMVTREYTTVQWNTKSKTSKYTPAGLNWLQHAPEEQADGKDEQP